MGQTAASSSTSVYDPYASAIEKAVQRLNRMEKQFANKEFNLAFVLEQPNSEMFSNVQDQVKTFKLEYGFLLMFTNAFSKVNYNNTTIKWKPEFAKVEDEYHEIGKKFNTARGFIKISKLAELFSNSLEKILVLKPEIAEICYYLRLSMRSVCHGSWSINYDYCNKFMKDLQGNLQTLLEKADLIDPPQRQIKAFAKKLGYLRDYIDRIRLDSLTQQGGDIVVRASIVCCLWWCKKMDPNVAGEIGNAFLDLLQKIDPSNQEFLQLMTTLLEEQDFIGGCEPAVRLFVYDLLHIQDEPPELYGKLVHLISSFIRIRRQGIDERLILQDIAAALGEVASLEDLLSEGRRTGFLSFKMVAKICVLRSEIFYLQQLSHNRLSIDHEIDFSASDNIGRMFCVSDHVKVLHHHLEYLGKNFAELPEGSMENGIEIFMLIEGEMKELESLQRSLDARMISKVATRDVLCKLFLRNLVIRTDAYLMDLMASDAIFSLPMKDHIGTLKSLVGSLIKMPRNLIFMDLERVTEDDCQMWYRTESIARRVISFYHSFHAAKVTEDVVEELSFQLSGLINRTEELIEVIDIPTPKINCPKIMGLGFIDLLSRKLQELLGYDSGSFAFFKQQIEEMQDNLGFLKSFFMKQDSKHQKWKDVGRRTADAAYMAEFLIDSIVTGNGSKRHNLSWLYRVSADIRLVKMQVEDKTIDVGCPNAVETMKREIPQTSKVGADEDVLVLEDQQQMIVSHLTRGSSQRDIVSIVGMGGIGKTTLANKVYNDPKVVSHFHIRACCLLEVLGHIIEVTDNILVMPNEDLELLLYQNLRRNRYLVFMDDVWNIEAWNELQNSFPDDRNGSRILITSRLHHVVSQFTEESDLLNLRPLSDNESWELLKRKIFTEEGCPKVLVEVGKEIARNCQGLPLSVVAIAGLLKTTNKIYDLWKEISESLNSLIVNDRQTRCLDILELSYKHLPDYLKACFLYFGAFQGNKEIPVQKLMWLWMAEGFIQDNDLAEDYLRDLIERSLIIIAKRRSNGRVKACRVHDMVLSLCLLKVKQENFLSLISSDDEPYASFDDIVDFDDFDPSNSVKHEAHRLCFCISRKLFFMSRPSGPYVRSLLFSATTDMDPRCPYDISFIFRKFKLLKILDFSCVNMGNSFPDGIQLLLQLRYLAVSGYMDSVPPSLADLQNLETLIIKGLKGKVLLPDNFWSMTRLRHVHVDSHANFTIQDERVGSFSQLINLVSFSTPYLSCGEGTEEIIRRMPNLKKLSCAFTKSGDYSQNSSEFPRLEDLTQLESLKILYRGRALNAGKFCFPSSLRKLSLSHFSLRWDHISTIGSLENLEVLKLVSIVFEDTTWDMSDEEFPELKFLKLDNLNIAEWIASEDHMPKLQQLVLQKCEKLNGVPIDFVEISTLQMIEVQRCSDSVEKSVMKLKEEEKLRFGTDDLKVLIIH